MAKSLEEIVKSAKAEKSESPAILREKPTEINPAKLRESDQAPQNNEPPNGSADFLAMLKAEVITSPFLSVAEQYVKRCNPRTRSLGVCMAEFRKDHKKIFRTLFFLDSFVKGIYITILIFVVIRGVGILEWLIQCTSKTF